MPRLAYFGPHGMPKSQWRFWRKAWNAKDERPPTLFPQTWMKVVKPFDPQQPSNVVQFECSFQMNKIEIKDYLTTIYNVAPTKVNTMVMDGERFTYRNAAKHVITHTMPHKKIAWVTLPEGQTFTYPDFSAGYQHEVNESKEVELSDPTQDELIAVKEMAKERYDTKVKLLKSRSKAERLATHWFSEAGPPSSINDS